MKEILADIANQNLGQALIRLWLLAESTVGGVQMLSTWLSANDIARHEWSVKRLIECMDHGKQLEFEDLNQSLALISALDQQLALATLGAWRPGMAPALTLGDCTYWLVRRDIPPKPSTPAERQNPNLEHWFRHFRVLPSRITLGGAFIDVELKTLGDVTPAGPRPATGPSRVHLSHFQDGVALRVKEDPARNLFHALGLTDEVARADSLRMEFDFACEFGAQLWVAPELTVLASLRLEVARWLVDLPGHEARPLLSVPGSFHETVNGGQVNRAAVIDRAGKVVARHDKLTQFSYDSQGVTLTEDIRACRRIELLMTPIGVVGVAICKDFSDASSELVNAAWNLLAPDWLLVPSMGDQASTQKRHLERAEEHWKRRGIRSVVANQEAHIEGCALPPDPAPGFVCPAIGYAEGGSAAVAAGPRRIHIRRIK
ncbi:MAG: hypothetical protein U1A72_00590 [Sulfuritalea sp.]|nr:hypothetical protein [Sulfuritalea sp.]